MRGMLIRALPALLIASLALPAQAKDRVSFSYNLDPSHDAAVWPIAAGKITSDLIDVDLKAITIPAAMTTKQYDTIENGVLSLEDAEDRGLKMTMLGIELRYKPTPVGFGIWAKNDSGIKTIQDLKGRKIAAGGFRSTVFTVIRIAMQKKYGVNAALNGGDFNFVEVPGPGMMPALLTGRVDAAALSHIQSYDARQSPDFHEVVDTGADLPGVFGAPVITSVIMGYKERVDAHPEEYRELLRMLKASSDYVTAHPDEVFNAVGRADKIDPAFLHDWFAHYSDIPITVTDTDITTINREWVLATEIGATKQAEDVRKWLWKDALKQ